MIRLSMRDVFAIKVNEIPPTRSFPFRGSIHHNPTSGEGDFSSSKFIYDVNRDTLWISPRAGEPLYETDIVSKDQAYDPELRWWGPHHTHIAREMTDPRHSETIGPHGFGPYIGGTIDKETGKAFVYDAPDIDYPHVKSLLPHLDRAGINFADYKWHFPAEMEKNMWTEMRIAQKYQAMRREYGPPPDNTLSDEEAERYFRENYRGQ